MIVAWLKILLKDRLLSVLSNKENKYQVCIAHCMQFDQIMHDLI